MNFPKLNDAQLNQLFWLILCATITGLLLAKFIRKVRDAKDREVLTRWLTNPLAYLGLLVVARLLLVDSNLVRQPPAVAVAAIALVGLTAWTMVLFPPSETPSLRKDANDSAYLRNAGLFFQAILLLTTFDILVYGSAATCWVWLLFAALQTLLLLWSFFQMVRKHVRQWNTLSSRSVLLVGFVVFAWALYCASGLMRTAVTEYYGTSEPGGLWEKNQYATHIKIRATYHGDSSEEEGEEVDAIATVINHGVFWERLRELRIKSISFVKGHPQRIQSQDDELWPNEDATASSVTTTKGASVTVSLTDDERKRFKR